MSTKNNKKAFMAGLKVAKEKIHLVLLRRLAEYGQELLESAQFRAQYTSFTGNTLTSLAFGLYENNVLTDIVFISGLKPPIRVKVPEGKWVYLSEPYEGTARSIYGSVSIYDDWGDETSIRTLKGLCPKGGNGIIVTTGTEYSTFLENVQGLNVLSDTYLEARNNALSEMNNWIDANTPIERL